MNKKLLSAKVLGAAVTLLSIAGMLLSSKTDEINRQELKDELKEELLNEMSRDK